MKSSRIFSSLFVLVATISLLWGDPPTKSPIKLPYVYTKWKQFTTADGLPNDHIFAVEVDGPKVWVGTEDGLACIDKRTGKIQSWKEEDGLPWKVVTGLVVDKRTGDLWLGLFGGGLARFSGGRFDHWHQMNSGLVNDVVYAVAIQGDNVWAATTAGCSRFNTKTGEWTIFTEKNAPMEEIWNYNVHATEEKVHLAVWGSGVLEFDVKTERWKEYLDPDGEMEIDLYRDDGIVHVITTAAEYVDDVLWVSSYFGVCRYDGRHWRGFYEHECGLPSDFNNNLKARSAIEAWFCTDKGLGACMDFETDTWVAYTRNSDGTGKAVVTRGKEVLEVIEGPVNVPQSFIICADIDGDDVWVGTGKGLGWGIGEGYYPGLKERLPAKTSNLRSENSPSRNGRAQ
ncbi:MAG TPA: regulator [Acidobacteriota bacterium]|nr:regulator [Acidobacteriota bacterium]